MENNLTRSTRRRYLTRTGFYKQLSEKRFNHPQRVEYRENVRQQGLETHEKFKESIQREIAEKLAPAESKMIEILNSKKLEKAEVDAYMEKWVDVNFWPRPVNYHQTRKELKKLNKKYGI